MNPEAPVALTLVAGIAALFGACGDRVGEPIVAAAPQVAAPAAGGGGQSGLPADSGGSPAGGSAGASGMGGLAGGMAAGAGGEASDPYGGLCTPCTSNDDCGDPSDHCLESPGSELFCGRDCEEWSGCPVGYECLDVGRVEPQCVPRTETCIHLGFKPPPPSPAEVAAEAIDFLNDLRAERGLYALETDDCLAVLAEQSAIELAQTGDYFGKFERECLGEGACECGWRGEFEIGTAAYDLRYDEIFERPILGSLERQPDDFRRTLFSDEFTRVGYGFVLSGDEGFAAYSLGP